MPRVAALLCLVLCAGCTLGTSDDGALEAHLRLRARVVQAERELEAREAETLTALLAAQGALEEAIVACGLELPPEPLPGRPTPRALPPPSPVACEDCDNVRCAQLYFPGETSPAWRRGFLVGRFGSEARGWPTINLPAPSTACADAWFVWWGALEGEGSR